MTGESTAPTSAPNPAAEAADATGGRPAGGSPVADGSATGTAEAATAGTTDTAGTEAGTTGQRRRAPWTGRRKVADPKTRIVPIRFTPEQYEQLSEKANRAGVAIGTAARTILLGSPGPRAVKRPPVEKAELARLLGAIGKMGSSHNKIGSNVNQIAKALNEGRDGPTRDDLAAMRADIALIRADTALMRAAVMAALGRGRGRDPGDGDEEATQPEAGP